MLELLQSKGAKTNIKTIKDEKRKKIFLIMIISYKSRLFNKNHKTLLHYAIKNNSEDIFKLLLSKSVDFDQKDMNYYLRRI